MKRLALAVSRRVVKSSPTSKSRACIPVRAASIRLGQQPQKCDIAPCNTLNDLALSCRVSESLYNTMRERLADRARTPAAEVVSLYRGGVDRLRAKGACVVLPGGGVGCGSGRVAACTVIFAFRGATSVSDLRDAVLECKAIEFEPGAGDMRLIHSGFMRHWRMLQSKVEEDFAALVPPLPPLGAQSTPTLQIRLVFTGHSMGGSLAMIAAAHLDRLFNLRERSDVAVEIHTFGTPHTGNLEFVRSLPGELVAVRNRDDVIPQLTWNRELTDWAPTVVCVDDRDAVVAPKGAEARASDLALFQYLVRCHSAVSYIGALERCRTCVTSCPLPPVESAQGSEGMHVAEPQAA